MPADDCRAVCHRRTGVRQPVAPQAARPFHVARAGEGGWAMEAVRPGAQHRKAWAPRIRDLGKLAGEMAHTATATAHVRERR